MSHRNTLPEKACRCGCLIINVGSGSAWKLALGWSHLYSGLCTYELALITLARSLFKHFTLWFRCCNAVHFRVPFRLSSFLRICMHEMGFGQSAPIIPYSRRPRSGSTAPLLLFLVCYSSGKKPAFILLQRDLCQFPHVGVHHDGRPCTILQN